MLTHVLVELVENSARKPPERTTTGGSRERSNFEPVQAYIVEFVCDDDGGKLLWVVCDALDAIVEFCEQLNCFFSPVLSDAVETLQKKVVACVTDS